MGKLTKTVLGRPSGRVGDIVFRQMAGNSYMSARPSEYPKSNDPAVLARRANFSLLTKFGSAVNSIEGLKGFWKDYAPTGLSPYNLMCRTNHPFVADGVIDDRARIVPVLGFEASASSLELTRAQLSVVIEALGSESGINEVVETDICLAAVVHFSNPDDATNAPNEMIALLSASQAIDLLNPLTFDINLDNVEGQIFDAYQDYKVFAAVYTLDADDEPVHFSNTITG